MNTIITSPEAIILASRKFAAENGLSKVNMRDVATTCGISVGSVYNYFPSKTDLIAAIIEDIWKDIFQMKGCKRPHTGFLDAVEWLFKRTRAGTDEYPDFFTMHAMSFAQADKSRGRAVMNQYFGEIKQNLLYALQTDTKVKEGVFDSNFSQEGFVEFVFSNIILALTSGASSCSMLLQVIRKAIYL